MKTHSAHTLFLFSILLQTAFSHQEIPLTPEASPQHPKILSFRDPSASSHHQDLDIVPGLTRQLVIELKGESEVVSFDFRTNGTDSSLFEIFVMVNSELEKKSYLAKFDEPESLTVSIDHQAKRCYIRGDKGFSLTSPLEEGDYKIRILQSRDSDIYEQIPEDESLGQDKRSNVLFTGFVIGSLVVAMLGAKMGMKARVKRSPLEVRRLVTKEEEKDCESNGSSQIIVTPTRKETCQKGSSSPVGSSKKAGSPYGSVSSETSISSSYRVFKFDAEEISQTQTQTQQQEDKGKATNFVEEKQEDPTAVSLALDFGDGSLAEKAIRALVKKLEEQGELGNNCDPSIESDDEDQYEAPQLPDYFCCLVCLEGKRCTVVQPCQHIFACTKCIDERIDSQQSCVLCGRKISGYEMYCGN